MKKLLFLSLLFIKSLSFADTELPKINFGNGVNLKTAAAEISDSQSSDMNNMINNQLGSWTKRNGSKRYIEQSISSNPVTGIYRVYASTNQTVQKALLASSWDGVFVSTTETIQNWIKLEGSLPLNQHYSFVTMNNKAILCPQNSTQPLKQFDILTNTLSNLVTVDGTTPTVNVTGKYGLVSKNYFLVANCADLTNGTTFYPSRLYYSKLANASSMTAQRFIDFMTNDGEEITAIWEQNGVVEVAKPSSITELSFSILDLQALSGDQQTTTIVRGFGVVAPRSLQTDGVISIFAAKDGIRFWDGGRKTRLLPADETSNISIDIQPLINSLIRSGTYKNIVGKYYPKQRWYLMSYEDPTRFPKGKNNSVMVYDLNTRQWFPFRNWNVEAFETFDGPTDNGELLYGSSEDGYVFYADRQTSPNDARKEVLIDSMENTTKWKRGNLNFVDVKEGSASIRMNLSASVVLSSITYMSVFNIGEWSDKTSVTREDKISFKVYTSSIQNVSSIRLDLEINDVVNDFDSNFSSVTISTNSLKVGNTSWATVEIPISSFPILAAWIDPLNGTFPFADALLFNGIRFVVTGVGDSYVSVDDLRYVQRGECPLNAYLVTKQFDLGTIADKRYRQMILTAFKGEGSDFNVDVYGDFGSSERRESLRANFLKDYFISGFNGVESVKKVNNIDFYVSDSTITANLSSAIRPLVQDGNFIFGGDQYNNRLVKIEVSSLSDTVFISTYGSFGSGTTNFNLIYQIAADDDNLYICDFFNDRVKVHRKKNLEFVKQFGSIGNMTTSYNLPTGVAVDNTYLFVANDGNARISKLFKSTGGYITSIQLNSNTIGDTTLAADNDYLYAAYQVVAQDNLNFQDVFLEKRNKSDLSLVDRIVIRPENSIVISTYALMGNISAVDAYIDIPFTDDANNHGNYYLQRRLKKDFSIVREYKTTQRFFNQASNCYFSIPQNGNFYIDLKTFSRYIQLRFSENKNDNTMNLQSLSFLVDPTPVREK